MKHLNIKEFEEMKRTDLQYIVDALLFVCITGITIIGILLGFVLPKGPATSESSKYFLGLHRHEWGDLHLYLAVAFTALAVLHLILAWSWIKGKTRQLFGGRWRTALISLPILASAVLVAFWAVFPRSSPGYEDYGKGVGKRSELRDAVSTLPTEMPLSLPPAPVEPQDESVGERHRVEEEPKLTRGRRTEDQTGLLVTGQMTLHEIERQTGIPAREIAVRLGFPRNVPLDERLGRLRKLYRFTMQDVREIISALM